MADARFKQLMLLPTCREHRAAKRIQRIMRDFLVKRADIMREYLELFNDRHEQDAFYKAHCLEMEKKERDVYDNVVKLLDISRACPSGPCLCPCHNLLAIEDAPL